LTGFTSTTTIIHDEIDPRAAAERDALVDDRNLALSLEPHLCAASSGGIRDSGLEETGTERSRPGA
jgi:hypothetical protein